MKLPYPLHHVYYRNCIYLTVYYFTIYQPIQSIYKRQSLAEIYFSHDKGGMGTRPVHIFIRAIVFCVIYI